MKWIAGYLMWFLVRVIFFSGLGDVMKGRLRMREFE